MVKRKKILFVCNYFAPDATIAAIRTTKLAKYLQKTGFEVDFLTVKNSNLSRDEIIADEVNGIKVVYGHSTNNFLKFEKIIRDLITPIKEKRFADISNRRRINSVTGHEEFFPFETAYPVIGSVEYVLNLAKQKDLFRSVRLWLDQAGSYDYLITSYGDAFCYFAGLYYKKRHSETKWVFDIRDSIYRYKFTPKYVSFIPRLMEKRVWINADIITGVSKGICSRVAHKYRHKVYKVTNGYDLSDGMTISDKSAATDKFIMTFTGSMYGGLQDLTPLFKVIRELVEEGDLSDKKIEFHFAGTVSAAGVFREQLAKYKMEKCMVDHGKLSRREALSLQSSSDVLLAPSYDYERNKGGIITGKFFEYMLAKRPIIVVVTGDIVNSEIADITRKCNIGFAYEESNDLIDHIKLKEYVKKVYDQKEKNGCIEIDPDINEMNRYDYRNITKRLIRIMESKEKKI